jgi:hypothetical protein
VNEKSLNFVESRDVMSAQNINLDNVEKIKIESIVLNDGRKAERHTCIDTNGLEVTEIFAEEKRPLKLEKRITRKSKNIIAEEIHETIKDGEVSYQEILSLEPDVPLQTRSKIGVVDHAKIVDGDYVRKDEIGKMIEDSVVAGITTLIENMQPIATQSKKSQPSLKAQEIVEKNVEEKKKSDSIINMIMIGIIVVQVAFFLGYSFLM